MKLSILISVSAAVAATAQAAPEFIIGYANTTAVPATNDFQAELAGLGYTFLSNAAVITLTEPARIRFEVLGSENGDSDRFVTISSPALSYVETSSFADYFAAPLPIGAANFGVGLLTVAFQGTVDASPGDPGFAVYLPVSGAPGELFSTSVVFGYDDRSGGNADFDDLIVRATIVAVPEPATWAMLLMGFGLLGRVVRVRQRAAAVWT